MRLEAREIARVCVGTKNIMNTEFSIESFVERIREGKRVYWLATYGLCNGIPVGSKRFKTQTEAVASIGD